MFSVSWCSVLITFLKINIVYEKRATTRYTLEFWGLILGLSHPMNSSDTCKQPLSNGARKKLSWSALRFCHRRSATIACPGDVLHAQKKQKNRNDDEAHPGTGTTSSHSCRRMQPNPKHNDNAHRVLAVNFNHRRNQKKTARSTCTVDPAVSRHAAQDCPWLQFLGPGKGA